MSGLGWQEIVIVLVILGIFLVFLALPVYLIVRTIRHHARHELLRESYRQSGRANVPIYAGFWDRVGASFLDSLLLLLPALAIQVAGQRITGDPYPIGASLLATVLWVAYLVVGNGRGGTLGKRWAGLRVVDAAGAVPGLQRASVRVLIPLGASLLSYVPILGSLRAERGVPVMTSADVLPLLAFWLIIGVDTLWMIWDPRKQTLHDKLAGTFVIVPW